MPLLMLLLLLLTMVITVMMMMMVGMLPLMMMMMVIVKIRLLLMGPQNSNHAKAARRLRQRCGACAKRSDGCFSAVARAQSAPTAALALWRVRKALRRLL